MMLKLTPEQTTAKILVFIGIIGLFSMSCALMLLQPERQRLANSQKQLVQLNQQWQKQQAAITHRQQMLRDRAVLQYSYSARLKSLRMQFSRAALYAQINSLAKSHHLKILALKPQQYQSTAGLQQQLFNINLAGSELKVLSFLHLLMHQPWLLNIQELSLISLHTGEGIQLQAVLTAYYD